MRKILLPSIFISLVFFLLAPVSPANAGTIQITNNDNSDYAPRISNGKVIWYALDGNEIFLYDYATGTTTQISNSNVTSGREDAPKIDNGKVVWFGSDGFNDELILYDSATGVTTQVTNNNYDNSSPQISGDKVVWLSNTGFSNVFLYDAATGVTTQLTNNNYDSNETYINDGNVVWFNMNGAFLYDIATETTSQIPNVSSCSDINNGKVACIGGANNDQIALYDISTGITTQITNNDSIKSGPRVSNGKVVWSGTDESDYEIYLYDIMTGITTKITDNTSNDLYPQINGGKIVWSSSDPIVGWENLVYDIGTGVTVHITDGVEYPQMSNGQVVWSGSDGHDGEIFLWDESIPENTAPIIDSLQNSTITLSEAYTTTGSFTDPTSSSWSATVDYGDGSGEQPLALNGTNFALSHVYTTAGTYTVTVVVTDDGGLSDTETAEVTVTDPQPVTLYPTADTFLKEGSPNQNEGSSTLLRVQSSGHNRAMVKFDQSQIAAAVNGAQNYTAKLQFTISDNGNNWGSSGRVLNLHRMTQDWTEGNGFIENNNPIDKGTGNGTTWNCATDANISNGAANCSGADDWNMSNSSLWPFASAVTAATTITNNQSGIVEFDVTADVQSFISGTNQNFGWLLKKENEGQNGRIEFGTKESGNTPVLVISFN